MVVLACVQLTKRLAKRNKATEDLEKAKDSGKHVGERLGGMTPAEGVALDRSEGGGIAQGMISRDRWKAFSCSAKAGR
jgi:hypothetical protein